MSPNASTKGEDPGETGAVAGGREGVPAEVSKDAPEATPGRVGVEAAPDPDQLPEDQEELRAQIEETREELGDTVEALSAKADVRGQAKEKVEEGKQALRDQQARAEAKLGEVQEKAKASPGPFAAAGVVALLLLILLLRRRR